MKPTLAGLGQKHLLWRATARVLIALLSLPPQSMLATPGVPWAALTSLPLLAATALPAAALPLGASTQNAALAESSATAAAPQVSTCRDDLVARKYPVLSTAKQQLWPPNHDLIDVGLRVDVGSSCLGRATVDVAVYSDEPDDAQGDGNTIHDAQLDPPDLYLRSERQGLEDGRVYLIVARSSYDDASGRACGAVTVPHSQSRADRSAVEAQARTAIQLCGAGAIPVGYHLLTEGPLARPNAPPDVNAGPDQAVEVGAPAHLDGTVRDDGLPNGSLVLSWTAISGPGSVVLNAASAEDTDATFSALGSYVLRLSASDGELSAADEVVVVVSAGNTAPIVDAGPDVSLTLPQATVTLAGRVDDDGRIQPNPTVLWSVVSGPGPVAFAPPNAPVTSATFPGAGEYQLQLSASDGQFTASDDVRVTVSAEPPPTLAVQDATVHEGNEGLSGAVIPVQLSKASPTPVRVDFVTVAGTAGEPCDYRTRYGTLEFAPGETEKTVLTPIVGDQIPEGDEDFQVLIANADGAGIARDHATVLILDDDGPNHGPTLDGTRTPPDGVAGVAVPPVLSWSAADPDAGDTLVNDVYLGRAFSTTGQQWLASCAEGAEPGPRWGAVSGYDEASDRLIVYGGETPNGPADQDLRILVNASATGGTPAWLRVPTAGSGPGPLAFAASGYDAASNRLVVFGGCVGSCDSPSSDVWVLLNANGLGGAPEWTQLQAGSGPEARFEAAAAFDSRTRRLYVLGGAASTGDTDLVDLWVLNEATGVGTPVWLRLENVGDAPGPRRDASLSLDRRSTRLVLFGGRTSGGTVFGDVRVLEVSGDSKATWRLVQPAGTAPGARFGHSAAYDAGTRRLVVYGGSNGDVGSGTNYVFGDTWMLSGADGVGTPEWIRVDGGRAPIPRFHDVSAFAEGANRLIVALGRNNKLAFPPSDLWVLADASGQLPLAEAALAVPSYTASEATTGDLYYWRVVARDGHGAWRGSPAWSFTSATPELSATGATVVEGDEGDHSVHVSVRLSRPSLQEVRVSWSTADGTAQAGSDYVAGSGTAVFAPGDDTVEIPLVIHGDRLVEGNEQFSVVLASAQNAVLGPAGSVALVQVVDDDQPANVAPIVNAGPDRSITSTTTLLEGTVSDDGLPRAADLTALWVVQSGPGVVTFDDPSSAATSVSFGVPGTYALRLSASDSALEASDEVVITVTVANSAPAVDAGPDLTVPADTLVSLQGTASDDGLPGGSRLVVSWSSPAAVAFDPPDQPRSGTRFAAAGTYVVRLTATDGERTASDEALITVTPRNAPPTVDAGPDQRIQFVSGTAVGKIVVNGDEWTLSDSGFSSAPDTTRFVLNLGAWLAHGPTGRFLARSTNFGLVGSRLASTMRAAGHTWVVDANTPKTLDAIRGYDAIFLSGDSFDNDVLIDYVLSGGSVYIAAGTGWGGAAIDAGAWARLLSRFSLRMLAEYRGQGTYPLAGTHSVFQGVSALYFYGGNPVESLDPLDPRVQVFSFGSQPFIGLFDPSFRYGIVPLSGAVTDDGLPVGSAVTSLWTAPSAPGPVSIESPSSPTTRASVTTPGTYTFRLEASDSELSAADEFTAVLEDWKTPHAPAIVSKPLTQHVVSPAATGPTPFSLRSWKPADLVGHSGQWQATDDSTVRQTASVGATAILSDFALSNDRVEFRAGSTGSGNSFGFVFGYQDAQHFYVFDWRRGLAYRNGRLALTGMTVKRVSADSPLTDDDLWPRSGNGERVEVLFANDAAWEPGVEYDIVLQFRPGEFSITVQNGATVVGEASIQDASFSTGRFGFYAYDQGDVTFRAGARQVLGPEDYRYQVVAFDVDGDALTYTLLSGPPDMALSSSGLLTWPAASIRPGSHEVSLRVADPGGLAAEQQFSLTVSPVNVAPLVNAGPDRDLVLPDDQIVLDGSTSDDGLPAGGAIRATWTQVSGPVPIAFADASSPATSATLDAPGVYVLRLTAGDGELWASDDVTVTVQSSLGPNQPPSVRITPVAPPVLEANLLSNPGAESPDAPGVVTGWQPQGGWTADGAGAYAGARGFRSTSDFAGLSQEADLTAFAAPLPPLRYEARYRTTSAGTTDKARLQLTFLHAGDKAPLGSLDSGLRAAGPEWATIGGNVTVPAGTGFVAFRLLAENRSLAGGSVVFDTLALRPIAAAVASLEPVVFDDGKPLGAPVTSAWTEPAGPAPVRFANAAAASTTVTFAGAGTYKLRLTADDTELQGSADVEVPIAPANTAPAIDPGPGRTITLPAALALSPRVLDDGRPTGSTVEYRWRAVGAPGPVTFDASTLAATTARFTVPGTYQLVLMAGDGDRTSEASLTVTVNPESTNRPPTVSAGSAQTIVFPAHRSTTLAGTVSDDGLPAGSTVTVSWSLVSGPPVTSSDPTSVAPTVTFDSPGRRVLRLTATDSVLTSFSDVTLDVVERNSPPVVSAGPDLTLALPSSELLLDGRVSDDGLPSGSIVASSWRVVAGPGAVAFSDRHSLVTGVRFYDPGVYVLALRASDGELHAEDQLTVVVQATAASGAAPSASFTGLAPGTRVTIPIDLVGTVASAALASWQLEHRLEGDSSWTRFASGTTPVTVGVVGRFDPTLLLNGVYEIRLSVTDTSGRVGRSSTSVIVREQVKVGHFTVSFADMEVPVAGLPLRVTRTYDSRDGRNGDFGYGWRLDLTNVRVNQAANLGLAWYGSVSAGAFGSYCISPTAPQVVTLTFPDGRVQEFEARLTPQCQAFVPLQTARLSFVPVGSTLGSLEIVGSADVDVVGSWPGPMQVFGSGFSLLDPAAYRYTSPDGQVFVVDRRAGLKSITDRAGNVLTMTPSGFTSSHPSMAGSSLGIAFARDSQGRITRITDPDGRVVTYAYDGDGNLASVTDREDNATTFTYDLDRPHLLQDIRDPLGRRPIRNDYYEDGRLESHTDALGKTIRYQHDVSGRQEVVTDRTGAVRVLEYDERGNVVREADALGRVVVRTFDPRNNRLTETEPHDPAAPPNPIPTTVYTYDASDNLLTVRDPLGNTTKYTYNDKRQVLTTTDARGGVTTNSYDAAGNLLWSRDALASTTSLTYDARGSVLTQTVRVDGADLVTRFTYDPSGNLQTETNALGNVTTYTYDRSGRQISQSMSRTTPAGVESLVTTSEYDGNGRLTRTIDPDNTSTRTVYDALGRQVESYDKLNRKTAYAYDEMGRLAQTSYADGTIESHSYDAEGRRTSSTDRGGRTTLFEYDPLGRLLKTTHPDGAVVENGYDTAGRLVTTKDARGAVAQYFYDSVGRRTKVRDALGHETVFAYDSAGNQASVTDARGNTISYEYDALNRRTKTVFPSADGSSAPASTTTGYDSLGRRVSETDQAGKTTRFRYDPLGRLVAVVDGLDQETRYDYDEAGNRTGQTDANGHATRFEYDKLGRQIARVLPVGAREEMAYDPAGNLYTRTDFLGRVTTYGYDANNRLLSRSYPDPAEDVGFTYTPTGRRLTATDRSGTTAYAYDQRDRLTRLTYPDGRALGYDYDQQGNRTKLTAILTALSLVSSYTFDPLNRPATVTDPAGRASTYGYDPNGSRASLTQPNGAVTAYGYDALNRLSSLETTIPALSRHVQSYAFTLGPTGNRTRIVEHAGLPQQRTLDYSYDALYRLTGETVSEALGLAYAKAFTYDPVGNRLTQSTTLGPAGSTGPNLQPGAVRYGYDERDRLLSEQLGAEAATGYGWDANGNLTTKDSEATYTWDFENRLVRVVKTDGTVVAHAYDVDGNRIQTKVTPPSGLTVVTDYLVDTSGSLSHVVVETDGAGALKAYYVRGDDLLSVMRPLVVAPTAASDWQTRYYHADGLGSIRRLTDEAGTITDGYTYSAFGELLAHTGSDPQPYAFTGEPLGPTSGWQYHRARWMDPRVGRFTGTDLVYGTAEEPHSLHRFLYAADDPVGSNDPSGLVSNFLYGRRVHEIIGMDFITYDPAMRDSDLRMNAILDDSLPDFGKLRPDLIDSRKKQVYEIKTVRGFAVGQFQLAGYLLMLNWADPDKTHPWTRGLSYFPPKAIPVGPLATAVTFPSIGGVITYEVFDAAPIVAALFALAVSSTAAQMAQIGMRVMNAIMLNTLSPAVG